MDKRYSKNTEILKVQKYTFRIMIILKMKVKIKASPENVRRKIYKVKIKAVNGLEQELANFSHKGLES